MTRSHGLLRLALVAAIALSLLPVSSAWAQEADTVDAAAAPPNGAGGGFFAIGVNGTDLGPLNSRLRGAGYPTFPTELFAIGGGGYGVVAGTILLGGEGYGLIAPSRGVQGRTVSVGGGYGLFTVGYQFRPSDRLAVYPQVGVGGGGLSLEIGSAGAERFDDVLGDPNREASLEKGSVLLSLGGGLEYRFSAHDEPGGFQIGLRAGYLLSPYDTDWTLSEDRLSGGPDAAFSGPFVRVLVGGWGGD
jgi:opacity protein-like surface antigen